MYYININIGLKTTINKQKGDFRARTIFKYPQNDYRLLPRFL